MGPDPEAVVALPLDLLREVVERLGAPAARAEARGQELAEAIRATAPYLRPQRPPRVRRPAPPAQG